LREPHTKGVDLPQLLGPGIALAGRGLTFSGRKSPPLIESCVIQISLDVTAHPEYLQISILQDEGSP
jgi:hypothetical protein